MTTRLLPPRSGAQLSSSSACGYYSRTARLGDPGKLLASAVAGLHIPPMRYPPRASRPHLAALTAIALAGLALGGQLGCGASATPSARDQGSAEAPETAEKAEAPLPPVAAPSGHLARGEVDAALKQGPPWLLQRVRIEEVIRKGKFIGWRVLDMPPEWSGADIRTGDVVTRVNGVTLERPDDLWSAWTTLAVASDLRVHYERDGETREMLMPISGAPVSSTQSALERPPERSTSPAATGGRPHKTIVIGGN